MELISNGVLISGGAGFVGKALIRRLLDSDIPIVVLDIVKKPEALPELNERFKWFELSYLDIASEKRQLSQLVEDNDIKTVIHLATTMFPAASERDLDKDCVENMLANTRLFRNLYEAGCETIIFASSGGTVYGQSEKIFREEDSYNPNISYGANKAATEIYLNYLAHKYKKKSISLRISNPYGEEQNIEGSQGVIPIFLNRMFKGLPLTVSGSLKNKRDYIYIDDLVDAFVAAIKYKGECKVFNIGSGISTSLVDLIETMEKKLGIKSGIYLEYQSNNIEKSVKLDVSKARKELNWQAKVSLADGIEKLIKFHKLNT
ncbi:NAD-dependent epimerase/dehydratase family protein [Vibrio cholerae]|nr:NAD-dependent epimerase/dehydratase family protein [Vibrio cholerae]EJY0884449.1 NAD-dependent epimerase/dehydratase family protein [Vibrio cholerae]BCN19534.1 dTDP-4-dehydro-6-deoxyglucose reductase [Vibrio cholerae]GHW83580.1 UDP-glucose 4-epimerase [Vibrio cholerae]